VVMTAHHVVDVREGLYVRLAGHDFEPPTFVLREPAAPAIPAVEISVDIVEAMALIWEGVLEAMQGRFAEGRRKIAEGRTLYRELGFGLDWAATAMAEGRLELLADNPVGAEQALREGYAELERLGETGYLSTVTAGLAEATRIQGRLDEAVGLTEVSERAASPDDVESQGEWRSVRSQALAEQAALSEAERLASEAVTLLTSTNLLVTRAEAHRAPAAVLRDHLRRLGRDGSTDRGGGGDNGGCGHRWGTA
jgi:hypothetical protein